MKILGTKKALRRLQAWGLITIVSLLALTGALWPGGYADLAQRAGGWSDQMAGTRLTLATSAERGALAEWGQLLGDRMASAGPYPLDTIPSQNTAASLALLEEGRTDFAFASAVQREGIAMAAGVARLAPQYVHVIVPSGDEATTFRELGGLRLGVGLENGDAAVLARQILAFLNLPEAPQLITNHSADLEEAFLQGQIDGAFVLAAPFDNAVEALFATGWYRLLPLGDASTLALQFPGYRAEVLPAGLYGKSRDVPPGGTLLTTLAVDTYLVAAPQTRARHVSALLSTLQDASLRAAARLDRLTEDDSRRVSLTNLHGAALAYYDRGAPFSSKDFNRVLTRLVALAIILALTGGAWAWERSRSERLMEKAFLPYFDQLGKLGEAIEVSDDIGELSQQLLDLSVMQRQAEYEWGHGRLASRDLDRLLSMLETRSQMAYSKIQILLMAGEGGTPAVAASIPSRYEAPPSGNVWLPGGDTPHTRGEAERAEAPKSEIRTPNTFFIKTEEGVSELAAERPKTTETPGPPAAVAAAKKPSESTPPPPRPAPPVSPPRPAPEAATPEWVASFEDLGPELEVDEAEEGEARSHATRPMDPRQASANLYPTSVKLSAAMERQQAEGESAFRWLNTGVGESLSVPRPRRAQPSSEEEGGADVPHESPPVPGGNETPAPEAAPERGVANREEEFDVELDGEGDYEPIVRRKAPQPEATKPVEEPDTVTKAAEDSEHQTAGATSQEGGASRASRAASGGARAPKERGNRRRKKKARKKEEQVEDEAPKTPSKSAQPPDSAKPKDDNDQMSFF